MSNDKPAKKRKLPEIPRLEMNPREAAATLGVVRRITGRADSPATRDSPTVSDSPTPVVSPTTDSSPNTEDSPTIRPPVALPPDSPTVTVSPTVDERPKRRSRAEYRKGDSRVNNDFFDNELSPLPPMSQLLWLHLNRYRDRGTALTIILSWKKLADRFGDDHVHENTLRRAFKPLERTGLAVKDRAVFGKGGEQGIVFRLYTPDSPTAGDSPTARESNKRSDQKNKQEKEDRCARCEKTGGFLYPNGFGGGGVVKCDHQSA